MRNQPEYRLHYYAVQLLKFNRAKGVVYFHCPNGEYRSKRTAAKLATMGVLKGVADLCIVLPGGFIGFLELKAEGGYLSADQRAFRESVKALGALYEVARSPEDVVDVLEHWGALRSNRQPMQVAA
jgi:hypothetical protein